MGGGDTPSEPESSYEEVQEEDKVTTPPPSTPRETLPSFGDVISGQAGVTIGIRQPKQTWIETRPSASLPLQPLLTLVSPNSWGSSNVPMSMEPTHLLGILQLLSCLPAATVAMTMTAGSSSLSPKGTETPPKKAHLGAFLWVSSRYHCGVTHRLCDFSFSYFCP
jgi:hypothetical protein